MALFVTNTAGDKILRKTAVMSATIEENDGDYYILVKTSDRVMDIAFETDSTLAGIQTKASNLLAELES